MPHALLKDFSSKLPELVANKLGEVQAMVISKVNGEINRIIEEIKETCPPEPVLIALTKKVDALSNVISKAESSMQLVNSLPPKLDKPIKTGKVVVEILSHMPIPSSIPPGIGVPLGIIQTQSNLLVWLRKMIEVLENDQESIKDMASLVAGTFDPLKVQLEKLKAILDRCAAGTLDLDTRKRLLDELDGKSKITAQDSSSIYTSKGGYTYTLEIVEEVDTKGPTSRRKAIAKDYRGIIVLQGPFSFSSSTKILLDELKFRIDNNLP